MEIKSYVISVILAAIISGVVINLTQSKGAHSSLIKLLAGVFIALTVISPWKKFRLTDVTSYFADLETVSNDSIRTGEQAYTDALRTSIITQTESYILEKASSFGATLTTAVTLNDEDPPLPVAIEITGDISPYGKTQLKKIITKDLGIPEEAQVWK